MIKELDLDAYYLDGLMNSFMYVLIKEKINILINIMKFGKKLAIL